jgi:hypothetical protein
MIILCVIFIFYTEMADCYSIFCAGNHRRHALQEVCVCESIVAVDSDDSLFKV